MKRFLKSNHFDNPRRSVQALRFRRCASAVALFCAALSLLTCAAHAQGTITGRILNAETREPLAGASVLVSGTEIGTSTDSWGAFRLNGVPFGPQTIQARYVGFETLYEQVTVPEEGSATVELLLRPSSVTLPVINVNAMRAEVRVSPVTFSDITAREIKEEYGVQDVPILLSELPSTATYSENGNGIGYSHLNIRGFDQRRLAVMINGVPQNDPEDQDVYWIDFPDLLTSASQIQVQRGAGSAFYGPAAIGGSVNLVTSPMTATPGILLSTGLGSFNTRRYAASLSSGLIAERYSFSARLSKIMSDGYRDQSWTNLSSYYFSALRHDKTMTVQFNFYGGPIADALAYNGLPKFYMKDPQLRRKNYSYFETQGDSVTYLIKRRPEEVENFSQPHYELLHEWDISPSVRLNTTLFYLTGAGFFDYDGSWADTAYFRLTSQYGFQPTGNPQNAVIRAWVENKQYGILPRVTWKHVGGELIAGAELRTNSSLHWGRIQWAENLPYGLSPDYHYYQFRGRKSMASLFVHEMYAMRPDLNAMADLQFAFNQYHFYDEKFGGTDFIVPYRFLNPRIGLNWNIDRLWSTYINVSRTSREPRLNNLYDAGESVGGSTPMFEMLPNGSYDFTKPLVHPETLYDIELGAGFTAERINLGASLYWMNFRDEIVSQGRLDRFGRPITGNADRTLHQGIELTGSAADIIGGLSLNGNLTLSRNRIVRSTSYVTLADSAGNEAVVPVSLDGHHISGFPDILGNLRATYRAGGFSASLLIQYVGEQYTDNFELQDHRVDAFTVLNGSVGYRLTNFLGAKSFEFRVQISNLLNTLYAAHGEGNEFYPGAHRNIYGEITVNL